MSVKYRLPVPVFYFWRKLKRILQRGLSAIAEHLVLVLLSAYGQDPCTDFYAQYVKWRRFEQECAFWGLDNKILYLDSIFPQKTEIFGQFSTKLRKFRVKKALTIWDAHL